MSWNATWFFSLHFTLRWMLIHFKQFTLIYIVQTVSFSSAKMTVMYVFAVSLAYCWKINYGCCLLTSLTLPHQGQCGSRRSWQRAAGGPARVHSPATDIRGYRKHRQQRFPWGEKINLKMFLKCKWFFNMAFSKSLTTFKKCFTFIFLLKSWEIITEDEATMYSSQNIQNVQIPLSQSSCDIQTHLAEELSNRLTTSGSSATGQSTAYTVNYFSHCSNV